jgi:hypothetical protein
MSDGSQQGIEAERALKTILGGDPAPKEDEERSPAWWLKRLKEKNDDVNGYEAHAEVMAKYILEAYEKEPRLKEYPNMRVYQKDKNGNTNYDVVVVQDLSDELRKFYPDKTHPFRRALSEATGFSWGWAFNIARYALGLPPQPNPAIVHIRP